MLREEYSSKQGEIQSLKKTQDDLNANRDKISNYIRIMKEETAALDTNIKVGGYPKRGLERSDKLINSTSKKSLLILRLTEVRTLYRVRLVVCHMGWVDIN